MGLVKPSTNGLAVAKTTGNDASMLIGIYSPFKYGIKSYEGYDIGKLKNYCRFMEICEDRDYGANNTICPLFFNGASSYWTELPRSDDHISLNALYEYIDSLERNKRERRILMFLRKVKHKLLK